MRLSCNLSDPGFSPECFKFDIFFNGEILNNCITADEEEGFALVYRTDENGRYTLNENNTEILKDILEGCIRIIKSDNYL